jgi:fibronectin type 3 domain-containing protein
MRSIPALTHAAPRGALCRALIGLAVTIYSCLFVGPSHAVSVLTQHNDNARTGANLSETVLNTTNVNPTQFGLVGVKSVDGQIYAQPLYVPNVVIPGKGTHNVVYVATEHDSVYAFDADDPNAQAPLWRVSFINPAAGVTTVSTADIACGDISPEVGITGTPVIDAAGGTLYVVAKTKETSGFKQRLHALDITTGAEKFGGPVVIQASVNGTGDGNDGGGHVPFDALRENQRAGLLLLNGVVYIGWASHCDIGPYHGWVMGYNATTLAQTSVYNADPNGGLSGIWQGGVGLATDGTSIYCTTGNGTFDANTGGQDYGESVLKLGTSGGLTLTDWFTPFNFDALNITDDDVGAAGPMLIPGTSLVLSGSKRGTMYLLNTTNLGHFHSGADSQIVQSWQASGHNFGGTAWWASPAGARLYVWGMGGFAQAYAFNGATFNTTPVSQGTVGTGWPPSGISLSANGGTAGTGILWGSVASGTGLLCALDASNLANQLWNSEMNAARDDAGSYAKHSTPTIANGRVYLNTFSNHLYIYGLLPAGGRPNIPNQVSIVNGGTNLQLSWSAAPGAATYNVYRGTASNGEAVTPIRTDLATPNFTDTGVTSNIRYFYKITAVNASGESPMSGEINGAAIVETPYGGTPVSLPGKVEAENFDLGGEGLGYHETDATNNGGGYRPDEGVDLTGTADAGGGTIVGWIAPGEWMNYMVNVATAGTYTVGVRVASPFGGKTLHLEVGGVDKTGPIFVPFTGGWDSWQTIVVPNVTLAAGPHTIKMVADTDGFNVNWFQVYSGSPALTNIAVDPATATVALGGTRQFAATALDQAGNPLATQPTFTWTVSGGGTIDTAGLFSAGDTPGGPFTVMATSGGLSGTATVNVTIGNPYGGTPAAVPGTIDVENYDLGGEGSGYHDEEEANNGGAYRPSEGVDIEATSDTGGGYNVGWLAAGEWLNFTVDVAKAGPYALGVRIATPNAGTSLHIEAGGTNVSGSIPVPSTGGWQTWQTMAAGKITLPAGRQVIRLFAETPGTAMAYLYNINKLTLTKLSPALTSIAVSPSTASVGPSGTQQFSAVAKDQYGDPLATQPTFIWSSTAGGTIDASGLFTAGATTVPGSCTVSAKVGSVTGTAAVTLTYPQVLTTVTVTPATISVNTGTSRQFFAVAKDQNGANMVPQPTFTWTVSGGGTIGANGVFQAGATAGGPFTVTAAAGDKTGTAQVTVMDPPALTTIVVTPASIIIPFGGTQQFTAKAKDQYGKDLFPQPTITWTASGGGTISTGGLFTAASTVGGPYTVTATSGAVSGTASIYVKSPSNYDYNGDGKPDILLQNNSTFKIAIWYMNKAVRVGADYVSVTPPANWKVVAEADFNRDGRPDIALQNTTTRQIAFWYLNGATRIGGDYVSTIPGAGWKVFAARDLDKDGKPDLILQNTSTFKVAFWLMNGPTVTTGQYLGAPPAGTWSGVASGDFNGDGKPDIAVQNTSTSKVSLWLLSGLFVSGSKSLSQQPPLGWKLFGAADYDTDGKSDLLLQNTSTAQIALWFLNAEVVKSGDYVDFKPVGWSVVGPR